MPRHVSNAPRGSARRPDTSRSAPDVPRQLMGEIRQVAKAGRADDVARYVERALRLIEDGRPEDAVPLASRAKHLAGRSAGIREILALAHYGSGQWREAIREMQAYRRMSGREDEDHVVADCYRALGRPERAVEEAERGFDGDIPEEIRAECAVVGASALADLGRYEDALAFVRRFPTRTAVGRPFDLRVWYVTGDVLARSGRNEEALREFARILRHDPSAFDVAERLARLRA